ncbi:MAG: hypothetical protein MUE85_10570 [Microscillaceae bacterium]|jgi:hypothetical protein|nr:hypothetical protein [Microscillaceae bacterium]
MTAILDIQYQELDQYAFKAYNYIGTEILEFQYIIDQKLSFYTFQGYIPDEQIIELYKYTAQWMAKRQFSVYKSITDARAIEGSFDGINDWLMNKFIRAAIMMGLKYVATVRTQEFYSSLALREHEDMVSKFALENNYEHRFFDTLEEARTWLEAQP